MLCTYFIISLLLKMKEQNIFKFFHSQILLSDVFRCNYLKTAPFDRCHNVVVPDKYIEQCKHDVCTCLAAGHNTCQCNAFALYARECSLRGTFINWRENILTDGLPQCGELLK